MHEALFLISFLLSPCTYSNVRVNRTDEDIG
jgi:hypothetical protein